MSSEDVVPFLRQIGLNLYESRAYFVLVTRGRVTAKELGQITSIPQSRTYDVLSSLESKGFALSTPSSSTKTYSPTDPDKILSDFYGRKRKEIQTEMIKIQEQTEQRLESLHNLFSQAKEQFESVSTGRTQITGQPVFVIEGNQNLEQAMLRMIGKAEREFLRITKPPDSKGKILDPFYFLLGETSNHLDRAAKRGVQIRTLSLFSEIHSLLGYEFEDQAGNERRYLEREQEIPEKFILADRRNALLNLRDPISRTFGSVALMLESEPTCVILGEHFESMWEKAEPLSSVTGRVKKQVEEAVSLMNGAGFSKLKTSIYKILARKGAQSFETLPGYLGKRHSPQEITTTTQELLKIGIVLQNDWLNAIMARNPYEVRSIIEERKE